MYTLLLAHGGGGDELAMMFGMLALLLGGLAYIFKTSGPKDSEPQEDGPASKDSDIW